MTSRNIRRSRSGLVRGPAAAPLCISLQEPLEVLEIDGLAVHGGDDAGLRRGGRRSAWACSLGRPGATASEQASEAEQRRRRAGIWVVIVVLPVRRATWCALDRDVGRGSSSSRPSRRRGSRRGRGGTGPGRPSPRRSEDAVQRMRPVSRVQQPQGRWRPAARARLRAPEIVGLDRAGQDRVGAGRAVRGRPASRR